MKSNQFDTLNYRYELDLINQIYSDKQFRMPVRYVLGLTNECNLNCPFCFLQKHTGQHKMEFNDWTLLGSQLPENARVILFGGEPMFYKHFDPVYKYFASRFRCTVVTNGTILNKKKVELLLSEDGLEEIAVSIDIIGNTNRNFTGVQWDRLVRGIKLFNEKRRRLKRPPRLGIAAVILDETAEGLFDLHRFAHEELKCDHVTYCLLNGTQMQLSDKMHEYESLFEPETPPRYSNWDLILDNLEKIRQYDKRNNLQSYLRPKVIDINLDSPTADIEVLNQLDFPKSQFGPCKLPWSDCRVFADGSVTSCLGVAFGNFKRTPHLRSILAGPVATRFRRQLRTDGFFEQCARCVFLYDNKFAT